MTTIPPTSCQGFNVGAGSVKEGDTAIYKGQECKVLTIYQDGDVQIELSTEPPTYPTVKWRQVTPLLSQPYPTAQAYELACKQRDAYRATAEAQAGENEKLQAENAELREKVRLRDNAIRFYRNPP